MREIILGMFLFYGRHLFIEQWVNRYRVAGKGSIEIFLPVLYEMLSCRKHGIEETFI
jgi:hypothetical protein